MEDKIFAEKAMFEYREKLK